MAFGIETARSTMLQEADAIRACAEALDGSLLRAVELLVRTEGKIVVTGVGKSGLIGQKIVATLCSIGSPAVFMHPTDALHGDVGIYSSGDPSILISKSGATTELVKLLPVLRDFQSPIVVITANLESPLAKAADVVLNANVHREADPLNLAPTCSSIVALALGDALCCGLMMEKDFTSKHFAHLHSGGQLGRNLNGTVRDTFHPRRCIACVGPQCTAKEVVVAMTRFPLGAACVVGLDGELQGIITDGDLRRALQAYDDIRQLNASQIMTARPVSVFIDNTLREALELMENRPSQISVLPVVDIKGKCLGLVRIHDIYGPL